MWILLNLLCLLCSASFCFPILKECICNNLLACTLLFILRFHARVLYLSLQYPLSPTPKTENLQLTYQNQKHVSWCLSNNPSGRLHHYTGIQWSMPLPFTMSQLLSPKYSSQETSFTCSALQILIWKCYQVKHINHGGWWKGHRRVL